MITLLFASVSLAATELSLELGSTHAPEVGTTVARCTSTCRTQSRSRAIRSRGGEYPALPTIPR